MVEGDYKLIQFDMNELVLCNWKSFYTGWSIKKDTKKLGCKTIKKCDFDTFKRFTASKNMGHFYI